MKPRFNRSVHYARVDEGVFFRGFSSSFVIKGGEKLYPFVEQILPYLNGEHTLGKLVEGLSNSQKLAVESIVNQLAEHHMLQDCGNTLPHHLDEGELALFKDTLDFIADRIPSSEFHFEQFRNANVWIVGSDRSTYVLIRSLVELGLRKVCYCLVGDHAELEQQRISELLKNRMVLDPKFMYQRVDIGMFNPSAAELVIHIDEIGDVERCLDWSIFARQSGVKLLQAIVLRDFACIGPFDKHEEGANWHSAWHSLLDTQRDKETLVPASIRTSAPAFISLVGNLCAYEAFKHFTGVLPLETNKQVVVVDALTLSVKTHPLQTHPNMGIPLTQLDDLQQVLEAYEQRHVSVAVSDFLEQASDLCDPYFGYVTSLHPEDLEQLPLFSCRAEYAGKERLKSVYATGMDAEDARYRALRRALEHYVQERMDDDSVQLRAISIDLEQLRDLNPADMVLASGHTYSEWLGDGLKKILERFVSACIQRGDIEVLSIVPTSLIEPDCQRLWKTLVLRYNREVRLYRITIPEVKGIYATIAVEGDQLLALAVGREDYEALKEALWKAVEQIQLAIYDHHKDHHPLEVFTWESLDVYSPSIAISHECPSWLQWNQMVVGQLQRVDKRVYISPWVQTPELLEAGLLIGKMGVVS